MLLSRMMGTITIDRNHYFGPGLTKQPLVECLRQTFWVGRSLTWPGLVATWCTEENAGEGIRGKQPDVGGNSVGIRDSEKTMSRQNVAMDAENTWRMNKNSLRSMGIQRRSRPVNNSERRRTTNWVLAVLSTKSTSTLSLPLTNPQITNGLVERVTTWCRFFQKNAWGATSNCLCLDLWALLVQVPDPMQLVSP